MAAALLAMPMALAAGPAPAEFRNAEPTAFGSVPMPVYTDARTGEDVGFAVRMTLHPEALAAPAARYLVGFDLHDTALDLDAVQLTLDGHAVPIERDERGDRLQPRVILAGDALPRDGPVELVLSARGSTARDGQVHVGAMAIAFDGGWGTLRTSDGMPAQAYGFTVLMSTGAAPHGLEPGFRGQGNSALALAPLGALAAVSLWGLRSAWHRLHPPPPRRRPVRQPPPAPAAAPRPPAPQPAQPRRAAPEAPQSFVVLRPARSPAQPARNR